MPKQVMVVLTNAVEGRDDEFNDWYDNRHLADVVGKGPFSRAQRFRLGDVATDVEPEYRYLAIYEIEDGASLQDAREWILWSRAEREDALAAGREPQVPMSPAMADERTSFMFTALAEPFEKRDAGAGEPSG